MKTLLQSILVLAAAAAVSPAQQWEFGGSGGGGFLNTVAVTGPSGSARAGFQAGAALSGYVGYSQSKHFGGEIRYAYLQSNLKLKSGGADATFSGQSHVFHYDLIVKTTRNEGKVQIFGAAGFGVKAFRGTGKEAPYHPLMQFGYFTKTSQMKPMLSFGGGAKFTLTKKVFLRAEIRDYMTSFPKEIIAPAPGTKYGTLLHDIVPMVGLGFEM